MGNFPQSKDLHGTKMGGWHPSLPHSLPHLRPEEKLIYGLLRQFKTVYGNCLCCFRHLLTISNNYVWAHMWYIRMKPCVASGVCKLKVTLQHSVIPIIFQMSSCSILPDLTIFYASGKCKDLLFEILKLFIEDTLWLFKLAQNFIIYYWLNEKYFLWCIHFFIVSLMLFSNNLNLNQWKFKCLVYS